MWYQHLSQYLLSHGFKNDDICPCIFIKHYLKEFVIIAIYVDDLNIIGTSNAIEDVVAMLRCQFEMKDLGLTTFCLGLQIEHLSNGILLHQSSYIHKILKRFSMDQAHSIRTPMVVRSLDPSRDPFRPRSSNESALGPQYPYMAVVGALMYLANCTRPDISFAVNLLARYSHDPTRRHWIGIKQIFRYLRGTQDMGLFFTNDSMHGQLTGYSDAGFLSDPHVGRSQTGYVFLVGGTTISWRSTKQTLAATSSNHAEILALHEASRECLWLQRLIGHIESSCGFIGPSLPTVIYEDNYACINQFKKGFIKGDRIKHISPKFFFTRELNDNYINIQPITSSKNLADIFTKSLPASKHWLNIPSLGLRRLSELMS